MREQVCCEDCRLTSRLALLSRGKLITIYDVDMHLAWVATSSSSSGSSSSSSPTTIAKGKLRFPEVSHEIEDQGDDYTWETTLDSESDEGVEEKQRQVAYKAVKKDLAEKLLPAFKDFRATLVDKHARDLGHEDQQSGPNSGASTPAAAPAAAAAAPAAKAEQSKPKAAAASSSAVSTSTDVVELSAAQACSQSDLWDLLTNPARIPMWTRSPADFSLTPGAPFFLFGGNVRGKVLSVNEPSKLVMAWRPPTWEPKDHFGELELRLSEGEGSTDLKIRLQGVPQGEEESSRKGLEEMYMNGLKRLGLSAVI